MIPRLGLLLFLLAARFYALGIRPPHHDESVNGWFVDGIFQKGFYHYDPGNYHGPLFFYLLTFFEAIFGRTIEVLRIPTVLFGIALSLLPLLFKRWIGDRAAWIAAFFLAVSPAAVFYSRYSIHETGFAVACFAFLYFWLRARQEGLNQATVWGLGGTFAFMATMKENFILFVVSLILAEVVIALMPKVLRVSANDAPIQWGILKAPNPKAAFLKWLLIAGIAAVLMVIAFTGMGQDLEGVPNFFKAFYMWSETGSKGNGHQKPFYYWLQVLAQYEWVALLGLCLSPLALLKVKTEVRVMSALGFGLWLAYSLVAYKTPWCLLSFYFVLVLVAAYWISRCMENKKLKVVLLAAIIFGYSFSAYQSYDAAYVNVDSDHHPYIYGQTYREIMPAWNAIVLRYRNDENFKKNGKVYVVSKFTWPLPWIIGEIKQTAYYTDKNVPAELNADYILIDADLDAQYGSRIKGNYARNVYKARQWASPMTVYERK